MPKPKPEPPPNADDPAESRRFIDMAREVETDETPGATDRAFAKIIRAKGAKVMPDAPIYPILTYWYAEKDQARVGVGYLAECSDGSVWCFPEDETIGTPGGHVGAFRVDRSFLREVADSGEERRLYRYQAARLATPKEPQTPPPVQGPYQGD